MHGTAAAASYHPRVVWARCLLCLLDIALSLRQTNNIHQARQAQPVDQYAATGMLAVTAGSSQALLVSNSRI